MKTLKISEDLHKALRLRAIHKDETIERVANEILSADLISKTAQGK